MTADNYMREMIYGLLREEEKKKAPPRVFAPPKASDLVASARKIMAQHQCAIDPTWIKCRSWSNLEAAWLALGIDPNLTDPWRLDRDWKASLTAIAEDLARRLSRLVGEAGAPTDFIQVMTDLGIRPDWMDAEPIVTGEQDEASESIAPADESNESLPADRDSSLLEERKACLAKWLKARSIPPEDWRSLGNHDLSVKEIYTAMTQKREFRSLSGTGDPITFGTFYRQFWKMQREFKIQ